MQLEICESAVSSRSGSGQSPATKRFVVHFELQTALLVIAILNTPLINLSFLLFFTERKLRPQCIEIEGPENKSTSLSLNFNVGEPTNVVFVLLLLLLSQVGSCEFGPCPLCACNVQSASGL